MTAEKKSSLRRLILQTVFVLIGASIYGLSIALFYVPADLSTGGLSGISLILNKLIRTPVGLTTFILNVPLFLLGMRKIGRQFLALSLLGVITASVVVDGVALLPISMEAMAADRLLSALFAGALCGLGLGIVMASGGSTGGTDILGMLLRKKTEAVSLGRFVIATDAVIIAANTLIFRDVPAALYTAIAIYISGVVVDRVLYGANTAIISFVVTEHPEAVSQVLLTKLERGVTVLNGTGAYSGAPRSVLICAVGRRQVSQLRRQVKTADPAAFVIISEAREVVGNGFQASAE